MKYYVRSGDMRIVIDRESREEAVVDAIKAFVTNDKGGSLGVLTCVSEHGFLTRSRAPHNDDAFMRTQDALKLAGLEEVFV